MRDRAPTPRTAKASSEKRSLSQSWQDQSERWAKWARKPGHDSYWRFHRDQFFQFLPEPGDLTVDVGCGEGRVSRDLKRAGHNVTSIDVSEKLIELAKSEDPEGRYIVADAAALPLPDGCADLVIAFMSPQDIDDWEGAVGEIARILKEGGRACFAIVHPLNSSGRFVSADENSEFVIKDSYLKQNRYSDSFLRDGLEMTFHSEHRPLEFYSRALEKAGLLIEAIRENPVPDSAIDSSATIRWTRVPLFLHMRVIKLASR